MSDISLAIAQSLVATQSAVTQQALQTELLRRQAGSDQAVVALLDRGAQQLKAALPDGQGQIVDISA